MHSRLGLGAGVRSCGEGLLPLLQVGRGWPAATRPGLCGVLPLPVLCSHASSCFRLSYARPFLLIKVSLSALGERAEKVSRMDHLVT